MYHSFNYHKVFISNMFCLAIAQDILLKNPPSKLDKEGCRLRKALKDIILLFSQERENDLETRIFVDEQIIKPRYDKFHSYVTRKN